MTPKRRVTLQQIKDYLKNKRDNCNKPHGKSIAEDLLQDPTHPIANKTDENDEFSLRDIFHFIEVVKEDNNQSAPNNSVEH
jgi:hypothetical protein